MPASSTISKPPSLPSVSSSNIARPLAQSNTRAVVTAPPWAQDEPPSPTDDLADEADRLGRRSTTIVQPADLASSSKSSIEGKVRETDSRSRWWTFVRPREGFGKHDWRGAVTTDHQQLADDRQSQSQYLSILRGRESDESPVRRSTGTSPPPFGTPTNKSRGVESPRRGRSRLRDESRSNYAYAAERQDTESGEKSLGRSRKNRVRTFILSNIYVPLLFRFINITFTTSALAVAIRIRIWERDNGVIGALGSSPTLVIIFAPLTLVHVMVAIYVEYFSRPLGLWRTSGKLAHTLLEVCFICAWSSALSLCFDNYFTSGIPCAPSSSIAWYSELPRPSISVGEIGDTLCDSQLALICLVMVGLIMYCTNLVISLFRIFEKVKYHAGTRRRT